ncbi:leucine-rich repeat transmembrane neuronal protein 3-like [Periplaneta americana]|uniref:leucine-rich repeat transmembrane neuronal protein 3-like n=1 Tax=Periplaneta americana TaxID=6978 RepID=UPI0037E81AD9
MSLTLRIIMVASLLMVPAFVFCIWLLMRAIQSSVLCSSGCWCDPGGEIMNCSRADFQEIPQTFQRHTRLILDHNNLQKLGKNAFQSKNIVQLKYLDLDYCNISYIDRDAFNGLVLIEQLSLEDNFLTELKVGTFKNMTEISGLHLAGNRIEKLEVGIFEDLISLDWISLQYNLLHSLESGNFVGLANLRGLWLSGNRLSYLHPDVFMHLTKLNYLHLDENEKLYIPSDSSFLNSPTLETLDISECNLSLITSKSFENMSYLKEVDFSGNNVKGVDKGLFATIPRLSNLFLTGNPLECDCDLLEVWKWCNEHGVKTARRKRVVKCETPDKMSGMWWGVLDKAQCANSSIILEKDYNSAVPNYNTDYYYEEHYKFKTFLEYVHPVICVFLLLFGTIGNFTLVVVIICNSEMHTVPNIYILNLAFSDFLLLATNTLSAYIDTSPKSWQFGQLLCQTFSFLRHLSVGVSAYLIAIMSVQRYIVISRPLHNRSFSSMIKTVAVISIVGIWITCSLFAIPFAMSFNIDTSGRCSMFDSWKYYTKLVLFELLVFCVLPVCVIVCMYVLTARDLMRIKELTPGEIHNQENARRSTARVVLSLALVFAVSFLPYHIIWAYVVNIRYDNSIEIWYIYTISRYLLVFNSCFNPVALYLSSKRYKSYFKQYLLRCCVNNKKQIME